MKIVHVVARMITGSSGPSYSVPSLCKALAELGAEVELHMVGDAPVLDPSIKVTTYPGLPFLGRLGVSPEMKRGLCRAAETADIIHSHSLWMMPNIYPRAAAYRTDHCKLVVSPRGTLSDWALARGRFRKKVMWFAGQRAVLEQAHCIHATADEELGEVRRLGMRADVTVIPNGIDMPDTACGHGVSGGLRRMLFLSRIHPKKGVDALLDTWRCVAKDYPDWELVVAGPLDGRFPRQMQEKARLEGIPRVVFTGELSGDQKSAMYRASDCFVLPTHSENFGVVVAESLAHGTPVIVTRGAPWGGVEKRGCGWWIDFGGEALEGAMRHAMSLPQEELVAMGQKGVSWMGAEYSWRGIAQKMMHTYRWLHGKADRPEWVDSL